MASFANVYTHRKVAETAAKGCEICYKPSTSVLVTPENKDFFYICPGHLKDRAFCTPIIDKAAAEAKKKAEEERKEKAIKDEMERVKKEYEEKKAKKKNKGKDAKEDKDAKDSKDSKDAEKDKKADEKDDTKDSIDKDKADDAKKDDASTEDEPRVFALQKFVYQQRLEKKRQAEISRRNRERLANPGFFPAVPRGLP